MASESEYLQILNFDLKTLVCNQIYPYQNEPVRTFQDAVAADARGERLGEWELRMGESWRLFEHPRHSEAHHQVRLEFVIEGVNMRLFDRIHTAISRRVIHWLAAYAERVETQAARASLDARPLDSPKTENASVADQKESLQGSTISGRQAGQRKRRTGDSTSHAEEAPPRRTEREPHSNPEAVLSGKERVTQETASELLGVSLRRVRGLIEEGHLTTIGEGHAKQISVDSLRRRLNLQTNSEKSGNTRK
jgi:hypothetical protein